MPPGFFENAQLEPVHRSAAPPTATHEDLLRLTGVLSDASLSPAQRLAVYDDIVGLTAAASQHAGAACTTSCSPSSGLVATPVLDSAGPYDQRSAQQHQYNAKKPVADESRQLLDEQQADKELQELLGSAYLAVDSHDLVRFPPQGYNNTLQHNQQHNQLASLQVAWQQLLGNQQLQEPPGQQPHSETLQQAQQKQQKKKLVACQPAHHQQQQALDISQVMKNKQLVHQQLYAEFQQRQQPLYQHCMPDGRVTAAQCSQQHTPGAAAATVPGAGLHGADCVCHSNMLQEEATAVAGAGPASATDGSQSSFTAPQQPVMANDVAAVAAVSQAVGGTSSKSLPVLPQQQHCKQQHCKQQRHRHTTNEASDHDDWLPSQHRRAIQSKSTECDVATAGGPASRNATWQQQQQQHNATCEPDAPAAQPHRPAPAPDEDDDCCRDRQPAAEGTRARIRRNKVAELQQSVQALRQQVSQLCTTNTALRQHEQSLEGQLAQKESTVAAMLAHKHQAMACQPGSEKQTAGHPPLHLSSSTPAPAQQAQSEAYRLPEPSLGYHPSAFKQDYLPTVNGGLLSPGVFPMFSPLPHSAVLVSAQNIKRFVQDARELRAAYAGTDAAPAVEDHLLTRISTLQGLMRRYNVMNPVFLYQLRAVNLATGQPDTPPAGHWRAMAELMRGMLTPQETNNMKLSYRLFKASLRAIKKEQAWLVSQIITTSSRLQSSMAGCTDQKQQGGISSTTCSTEDSGRIAPEGIKLAPAAPGGQASDQSYSTANLSSRLLSDRSLLEQLQLQQQLDDLLQQMEQLLLREHDQHFILLWSCTKMPSSIKVFMELLLSSYPYLVNYHEILPHLFMEV